MATWNSRGLRGSTLEEFINRTNERYMEQGLALIQKIPTPITPVRIDKEHRHITLAYFEQKSTVDYIGAVQGIPVCFDAKECNTDTFPLQYSHINELYYMSFLEMKKFWERAKEGGRKSFRFEELNPNYFMSMKQGYHVPYLEAIQKDLDSRDE